MDGLSYTTSIEASGASRLSVWFSFGSLGIMQHPLSRFWQVIIISIMMVAMVSFLTGCGKSSNPYAALAKLYQPSSDTDVSSLPQYNFVSFAGTVWTTKVITAVANQERYTGAPEVGLLAPKRFDPTDQDYSPATDKATMANPGKDIIAVLPPGSRVQIERLMKDNGAWGGLMVTATVLSGTNAWKNVILDGLLLGNNQFMPRGWYSARDRARTGATNWEMNLDMLAPASNRSESSATEIGKTSQAGYKKGYANGKASAILAKDARPGNGLSDPWLGLESRPMAVKIYGEDYVAAFESGYRKGFHDYSEEK